MGGKRTSTNEPPGSDTDCAAAGGLQLCFADGNYLRTRYLRISSEQATRMMAPLMMFCMAGSMPSMVRATKIIRRINTPRTIPLILPVPPTKETPPMTQAAMASHS